MEHWAAPGFSAKAKSTHSKQKTARQAIPKDVGFLAYQQCGKFIYGLLTARLNFTTMEIIS